ncbi:unnamed protein product, partial [Ectocarpus sp. 8 AP-2014]
MAPYRYVRCLRFGTKTSHPIPSDHGTGCTDYCVVWLSTSIAVVVAVGDAVGTHTYIVYAVLDSLVSSHQALLLVWFVFVVVSLCIYHLLVLVLGVLWLVGIWQQNPLNSSRYHVFIHVGCFQRFNTWTGDKDGGW